MGSKSTATLLLYALHYAMGCESTEPMLGLIQKTQGSFFTIVHIFHLSTIAFISPHDNIFLNHFLVHFLMIGAPSDFARKVAYRVCLFLSYNPQL